MTTRNDQLLIIGPLLLAHAVDCKGKYFSEVLSGDGIFAAAGAKIWNDSVHLQGRIGSDFPEHALDELNRSGFDTDALIILPDSIHPRIFYECTNQGIRRDSNAAVFFRTIERPLPKHFIHLPKAGFQLKGHKSYPHFTSRPEDIPESLWSSSACLVVSEHYLAQISIPVFMKEKGVEYVVIIPPGYCLQPDFKNELPVLFSGITAPIISSSKLPYGVEFQSYSIREYSRSLCKHGCKFLVYTGAASGQLLWKQSSETLYHIPAYPGNVTDEMGASAAFAGGFLAGLTKTGDVLEAALYGSISASLAIEGTPALHALDALPGLAEARLESLRGKILEVVL